MDSLSLLLERATAKVSTLERLQQSKMLELVAQSSAGLKELRSVQESAAAVARDARGGYHRVTEGVQEIFAALQFHDSTRQRLEHVQSALGAIADDLTGAPACSAASLPQNLELQMEQLREAGETFLRSVEKVRKDLRSLEECARAFSQSADQLCGLLATSGLEPGSGLAHRFRAVGESMGEWIASRHGLAETADQARESCARLTFFTSEIETVGIRMLWLALNAEVQAAQLDSSGAVMESVAECIGRASQEASAGAAGVNAALAAVESGVERLTDGLRAVSGTALEQASALEARSQELARQQEIATVGRKCLLESIVSGGASLADDLSHLGESITADDRMEQVSAACLVSLACLAAKARDSFSAGSHSGSFARTRLNEVADLYTMREERDIHEVFLGAPEPDGAVVAGPSGDTPFGSNVELF